MPSLPLESFWNAQNASWQDEHGWKIPSALAKHGAEYSALTQGAALTDQSHRGKIKVTGTERVSFLNRMLTNDLSKVADGSGQRSFLLSAQGKCLADFRIFNAGDCLLLDTEPELAPAAIKHLERFLIADDVTLQDVTQEFIHLSIDGPKAFGFQNCFKDGLTQALIFNLPATASLSGGLALHILVPSAQAAEIAQVIAASSIPLRDHTAFNQIRLDHKVPRFKIDFDETWFLNETGLEETAASETKGCYPGQEVVARIKTYKKMERRLFL